uniref:uncharacterized protein LOC120333206 isoform X1 n=1 Tax=Styela clava TaxID=7725 RepID=UPI00193A2B18|nr:uncharacterized protein LOC120333206 isoform X1 [Styela clava]
MEFYFVTILFLIGKVAGIKTDPLVFWSMDTYDGETLLPDFGDKDKYSCDLTSLGNMEYVQAGIKGNALHLNKEKIELIENIWKSDCIRNPVECKDGLTLAFWLNVKEFTSRRNQVIVRSTTSYKSRPGIYIGGNDKDENSLLFFIRTAEGKQYEANLQRTLVMGRWTHVAMSWNNHTGMQVSINGTLLNQNEYTDTPSVKDVRRSYPMRVDFVVGDILGPIFSLDEFWIFYQNISAEEILSLYENAIAEETAKSLSSTTSTTEQTPGPRTTTAQSSTTSYNIPTNVTVEVLWTSTSKTMPVLTEIPRTYNATRKSIVLPGTTKYYINEKVTTSFVPNDFSPQYTNVSIFENQTRENVVQVTEIQTTTSTTTTTRPWRTSYNGWFYSQTWFHVVIICSFLLLLAVSIWLCVVHCCIPACEKEKELKQSLANTEDQVLEALV